MSERIKQAFYDYIDFITNGRKFQVNRLDLHEKTFEAGYNQGAEDKNKIIRELEEKLVEAEKCIKGSLRRFDNGCHVLYLGDTYLKMKGYESKYLKKTSEDN